jgi:hypothetical protein
MSTTVVGYDVGMTDNESKKLAALQLSVCRGNVAMLERNAFLKELYEKGATQPELAVRLNEVSRTVGDKEITPDAVYRAIKRINDRIEA